MYNSFVPTDAARRPERFPAFWTRERSFVGVGPIVYS